MGYALEYTDDLPSDVGGRCEYSAIPIFGKCTIKIRPKYKGDSGILAHELEHYRQFRHNPLHTIMYKVIESYRYSCELKAYCKQIEEYDYPIFGMYNWIQDRLAMNYGFTYSIRMHILDDVKSLYYSTRYRRDHGKN